MKTQELLPDNWANQEFLSEEQKEAWEHHLKVSAPVDKSKYWIISKELINEIGLMDALEYSGIIERELV